MTIKSPVLTTTTSLTAMAHGFISPWGTPFEKGIPIGLNTLTGEVEYFNPWTMKDASVLDNMWGLFLGLIRHGKSMAMKMLAFRLMMLVAGFQRVHTVINDYKGEGNGSEYGLFSQATGSVVHNIAEMQINPLEKRMFASAGEDAYELGVLSMAKAIIEFGKGDSLVGHEDTCLRIAIYTMLQHDSALWGLGLLEKLLRSITQEQITAYFNSLDTTLKTQLEHRVVTFDALSAKGDENIHERRAHRQRVVDQLNQLVNAKDNTNLVDIQIAGDTVSAYLQKILKGSFGKMLGDKHSLYEMATQPTHTRNWLGVSAEAETLMRIIDTSFKTSAIENHQLDLLPHINVDDERHRPMGNLIYARSEGFFQEISRSLHTCSLSASHRLDSLRKGNENGELYKLGNTYINNLGFVAIGKQNNDTKALKELQDRYGFTTIQRDNLPYLPRHVFALKYAQAEPLRFVQIVPTEFELSIGRTEGAIERMTTRPNMTSTDDIERYAQENNIKLAVKS